MTPYRQPFSEPDVAALLRYVSGQSPLAEADAIRVWIAADPAREATIDELRKAWNVEPTSAAWDKQGVWARLSTELSTDEPAPSHVQRPRIFPATLSNTRTSAWRTFAKAAVVLIAIGGGASLYRYVALSKPAPVTMREVATARGQQSVVDLVDGSRVILAAESQLRIPSDFASPPGEKGTPRRLELIGRAYFDVKHDSERPFIVRTATAVTQDIGTSFVITAYPEKLSTEVAVVDGSVGLWDRQATPDVGSDTRTGASSAPKRPLMVLTHGDVATLDENGTATRTRHSSLNEYTSWTRGILTFDNALLRDVIPELNRWYDLDVRIGDASLGKLHVTAEIRTETPNEAMQRLSMILGVDLRRDGRVITLVPKKSINASTSTQ